MCSLLNWRAATWWISHSFHLDLFATFEVENVAVIHPEGDTSMDHSGKMLIQEEKEVAEGEACFFLGMSNLCRNSHEASNMPTRWIGPNKQRELPLKVMPTPSKCICLLLLFHNLFLYPGCDVLLVWLQLCWCWNTRQICLALVYQLWKCDYSCYFKWSVFIMCHIQTLACVNCAVNVTIMFCNHTLHPMLVLLELA